MATYGLKTYKEDGTTVVLQNSSKSGVFWGPIQYNRTGVPGVKPPISFPNETGRLIRPMQLIPGAHSWSVSYPAGVPTITFVENEPIASGIPQFYYDTTVLYIFVR
jgi:hypothetical protein